LFSISSGVILGVSCFYSAFFLSSVLLGGKLPPPPRPLPLPPPPPSRPLQSSTQPPGLKLSSPPPSSPPMVPLKLLLGLGLCTPPYIPVLILLSNVNPISANFY
jgi:hypothetical protein